MTPDSGTSLRYYFYHISDGKVTEESGVMDNLSLLA